MLHLIVSLLHDWIRSCGYPYGQTTESVREHR